MQHSPKFSCLRSCRISEFWSTASIGGIHSLFSTAKCFWHTKGVIHYGWSILRQVSNRTIPNVAAFFQHFIVAALGSLGHEPICHEFSSYEFYLLALKEELLSSGKGHEESGRMKISFICITVNKSCNEFRNSKAPKKPDFCDGRSICMFHR